MAASTPFDRLTYPLGSFVQASNMYANGHWAQGVALSLDETRAYWAGKKGIYFADSRIQRALPLATALTPTGTQIGVDLAANMEYRGFERAPFVECRSGFFRPAGIVTRLSSCLACPSGTYSDYGSAGCPTCPAGAYCLGAGTPSFIPCPGATYNPNTGSSSLSLV